MERKKIMLLAMLVVIIGFVGAFGVSINQENNANIKERGVNEVFLWNYTELNNSDFQMPANYQDYVMPDNPIIKKYAEQLHLGINQKGSVWNTFVYQNKTPLYIIPKKDEGNYWQNPDYTLTIGCGDCEDMALVGGSIFQAKEINSVIVEGYSWDNSGRSGHVWVEYYLDGIYYVSNNFGGNLYSFKRKIYKENGIYYYRAPKLILYPIDKIDNASQKIIIPGPKLQPRYIFNQDLKKRPYYRDWIILI